MIARYINQLIQFGYWNYDIIFVDENNDIVNRNNTFFYTQPSEQDLIDRVNEINTTMEYNYNIITIETP